MATCMNCGYAPRQGEEWRDVPGLNGIYRVSNLGGAMSTTIYAEGRLLKPTIGGHGYPVINVSSARTGISNMPLHTMVAFAFIGPRPDGMHINHKNGIKTDASVSNLEYATPSSNIQHGYDTGLIPRGENHYSSKVTEAEVVEIRNSDEPGPVVATKYGIKASNVHEIRLGHTWKHAGGRIRRRVRPRLDASLVREIRNSKERGIDIAERLGLGKGVISKIRKGHTYRGIL